MEIQRNFVFCVCVCTINTGANWNFPEREMFRLHGACHICREYLHIICVCVLYLFRYLLSESSTAYVGHAEIHCVCVCRGRRRRGPTGKSAHTTRHNAPNAARNELRLAYTVRDMLFVCLPAWPALLLFLSKKHERKTGKTQFKLSWLHLQYCIRWMDALSLALCPSLYLSLSIQYIEIVNNTMSKHK